MNLSGSVVTAEVAEKIIRKEMVDPINGKKMTEKDFIYIQRVLILVTIFLYYSWIIIKGGTGFAGSGVSLTSKKNAPAMQ